MQHRAARDAKCLQIAASVAHSQEKVDMLELPNEQEGNAPPHCVFALLSESSTAYDRWSVDIVEFVIHESADRENAYGVRIHDKTSKMREPPLNCHSRIDCVPTIIH